MKPVFLASILMWAGLAAPLPARAAEAPSTMPTPAIPDALRAPGNETMVLVVRAQGVQTYECRAKQNDPTQCEWAFTGPEADLFDSAGHKIGRHYGGPTWELDDGSAVVGAVRATLPAPIAGTVPWLLLVAKSHTGGGLLSTVSSIQRLETAGGKAPVGGCSQANLGQKMRVPDTAIYCFYGPKA